MNLLTTHESEDSRVFKTENNVLIYFNPSIQLSGINKMNPIINRSKIIWLIYVLSCLTFPCLFGSVVDCDLDCFSDLGELECIVDRRDTQFVQKAIYECANTSETDYELLLLIDEGAFGVVLNLTLPSNIEELIIQNPSQILFFLETTVVNVQLITMGIEGEGVIISQTNFFSYFPNLEDLHTDYMQTEFLPQFSENKQLRNINMLSPTIQNEASRIISHNFVGGLEDLETLVWAYGDITGIVPNAFLGTTYLEELDFRFNNIHILSDSVFEGLDSLTYLGLDSNDIKVVNSNAFNGLSALEALDLDSNPSFPLSTIVSLKSLTEIYLDYYNGRQLPVEPFQQLPLLTLIQVNYVEFVCDCRTEWISKLVSFGIEIEILFATCVEPISAVNTQVNNASLYTTCPPRDYQCFNRSIVCEGFDWYKVDSGGTCVCNCPIGYFYSTAVNNIGCIDLNECEDASICQGSCTNIVGSYRCDCASGFVNVNESSCRDLDECKIDNGICPQNCTNTFGSYTCSCFEGFTSEGLGACSDVDECCIDNGNCTQNCTNTFGSFACSCRNGYTKRGITDCVDLGCATNNGGCAQLCNVTLDGVVCSCQDGYSISVTNISNCEMTMGETVTSPSINLSQPGLYIISFFALIFFVIIVILLVLMVVVCFYFRRQDKNEVVSKAACKVVYLPKRDEAKEDVIVIENQTVEEQTKGSIDFTQEKDAATPDLTASSSIA